MSKKFLFIVGFCLALTGLTGCLEEPAVKPLKVPQSVEKPTYSERVACEQDARKAKRSSGYCWANPKPQGATR